MQKVGSKHSMCLFFLCPWPSVWGASIPSALGPEAGSEQDRALWDCHGTVHGCPTRLLPSGGTIGAHCAVRSIYLLALSTYKYGSPLLCVIHYLHEIVAYVCCCYDNGVILLLWQRCHFVVMTMLVHWYSRNCSLIVWLRFYVFVLIVKIIVGIVMYKSVMRKVFLRIFDVFLVSLNVKDVQCKYFRLAVVFVIVCVKLIEHVVVV